MARMIFLVVLQCELDHLDISPIPSVMKQIQKWNFFIGFVVPHYGLGYGSVFLINGGIMEFKDKGFLDGVQLHRLVFAVAS
mmetsp:Transcript_114226/g.227308  ORF Transcript_114226/g.227308 Transcript_114226/m.227308 type:complete len:81 (+) Transcript_114226:71-313(+)